MDGKASIGHAVALCTVIVWGATFISTKMLLDHFTPIEILVIRFLIGFLALFAIYPHLLRIGDIRREVYFVFAGLTGACMYFLMENIALTYTMASNVGVIVAVAPFFTGILMHFFCPGEEPLTKWFFLGFAVSLTGIVLVSFNGVSFELNPLGDFLAVLAAMTWSVYSVLLKKISAFGYDTIPVTRRTFMYGLLWMLPFALAMGFDPDWGAFGDLTLVGHILFLGVGASAICFVSWGFSMKRLGAVSLNVYLYLIPVVTMVLSAIFLGEVLTAMSVTGAAMTLAGLAISQFGGRKVRLDLR